MLQIWGDMLEQAGYQAEATFPGHLDRNTGRSGSTGAAGIRKAAAAAVLASACRWGVESTDSFQSFLTSIRTPTTSSWYDDDGKLWSMIPQVGQERAGSAALEGLPDPYLKGCTPRPHHLEDPDN